MRELLMCENCRGLYTVGATDSTNHLCPFCAREMRLKVDTAINGQPCDSPALKNAKAARVVALKGCNPLGEALGRFS